MVNLHTAVLITMRTFLFQEEKNLWQTFFLFCFKLKTKMHWNILSMCWAWVKTVRCGCRLRSIQKKYLLVLIYKKFPRTQLLRKLVVYQSNFEVIGLYIRYAEWRVHWCVCVLVICVTQSSWYHVSAVCPSLRTCYRICPSNTDWQIPVY